MLRQLEWNIQSLVNNSDKPGTNSNPAFFSGEGTLYEKLCYKQMWQLSVTDVFRIDSTTDINNEQHLNISQRKDKQMNFSIYYI